MDIFLSINNREQVIKLPVAPSEFKIQSPVNNETFTTANLGDIKLLGLRGLKSISISSFFPVHDYPFLRDNSYKGFEYVEIIERWIDRRLPVRLVIPAAGINLPVTIDSFEYGPQDGSGDIYYTLVLSEFKLVNVG